MISFETPLLLSPVFFEQGKATPLFPPGLPHRALSVGLTGRVSSPNENKPPPRGAFNKKASVYRIRPMRGSRPLTSHVPKQVRNPLSDVTRLYDMISLEGDQDASTDISTIKCPSPPDTLVNLKFKPQSIIARRSDGVNVEKPITSQFDPFADDPAGPTQCLPSDFSGSLSELWPQRPRGPLSPTPSIPYTSGRLLPSENGFSSAPFSADSESNFLLARLVSMKTSQNDQLESIYFLPKGLLDDESL
ncbi:hypothetical protein BDZ94DRAFT_1256132 [Collybia nuda]|uniref:Uncharacterized protein n=1 Tax=Collybia nuda TaxID=64659 RepID=A0A9P6CG19_9AGAR|nr:hypothetical protein BDZ94DRAFT_1256132 [Collybia nuda]